MFMGNDEIRSTISLTKSKIRINSTYMFKTFAIIALLFLAILISTVITALKYKAAVTDIQLNDYSYFSFIGISLAVISMCVKYKQANDYFSVFPQTNTSRFLSSQIILYLWTALITITSFVLYLMQFLVFKLLSIKNNNIILAYKTDAGLILIGIFVYFLYGLLMVAFFSLVAAIIRKFNTFAVVLLLILAAVIFTSELGIVGAIKESLSFLIKEDRIGFFFLKGLVAWLLLFIASLFINKYTVYYKTQRKYRNFVVAAFGIAVIIVVSLIRESIAPDNEFVVNYDANTNTFDDDLWKVHTMALDASEYDDLSKISIVTNFEDSDNINYFNLEYNTLHLYNGQKIVVHYRLPVHTVNHYNLIEQTHPEFTATLENGVLKLNYSYDKNIKVLFIPPWSIMKQFKTYQDKELYSGLPSLYTTNSRGNGFVNVFVE